MSTGMEELRRALALLNGQGYEFMVFVKERDYLKGESIPKKFFSESFISSSIERDPPLTCDPLVNRKKITVYEKNIQPKIMLPLGQPILVQNYLCAAFKLLRQVPCKAIAKLWIKIIEPRKKTRFPYIKGDARKPTWWPKDVEHKEPDHLHKADRLRLMCTIIMNVLPQSPFSHEILDELIRVTVAMTIFKRENVKRVIIKNVLEIAKCLCNKDLKRKTVSLDDLNDLAHKQKKSNHSHRSDVNKMANVGKDLLQQSCGSDFSPSRTLPTKESHTEYLSRGYYPISEDYSNSKFRTEGVVDFDPLFLTKLDELSSSDDPRDFI